MAKKTRRRFRKTCYNDNVKTLNDRDAKVRVFVVIIDRVFNDHNHDKQRDANGQRSSSQLRKASGVAVETCCLFNFSGILGRHPNSPIRVVIY